MPLTPTVTGAYNKDGSRIVQSLNLLNPNLNQELKKLHQIYKRYAF